MKYADAAECTYADFFAGIEPCNSLEGPIGSLEYFLGWFVFAFGVLASFRFLIEFLRFLVGRLREVAQEEVLEEQRVAIKQQE